MPFELIVQEAFTERLPDNGIRIRAVGEHITDQAWIAALAAAPDDDDATADRKAVIRTKVVKVWVDEPPPGPAPAATEAPKPSPASAKAATPAPAPAPAAS